MKRTKPNAEPSELIIETEQFQPQMDTPISDSDIEKRAYDIWQREGCPNGRAADHWLQAEQELRRDFR